MGHHSEDGIIHHHQHRTFRSYEEQHIHFVTTAYGTSIYEIVLIMYSLAVLPLLASLLLPWVVPTSFNRYIKVSPKFVAFARVIIEFPIVMVLPVLIITVFAGTTYEDEIHQNQNGKQDVNYEYDSDSDEPQPNLFTSVTAIALTFIIAGILSVNYSITKPIWLGLRAHWNKIKRKEVAWTKYKYLFEEELIQGTASTKKDSQIQSPRRPAVSSKLPFVTNYRGLATYMTVVSILAVDFAIFPRRFCKTKLYGFSVMDLGTGSFVFANGIVSSEAKLMKSDLKKALKASIPIFILGFIRLLTVKGVEYHEVVEEYGVHWNFFFTLATVKILSALVFKFISPSFALRAACLLGCVYEILLVYFDLQLNYILNPTISREDNLLVANREGVFSTIGYTTIYLASIHFGQLIYNSQHERKTIHDWCTYAFQTFLQIIVLWIATYTSISYGNSSCRRVANLSYILWILTTNCVILWLCLTVHLFQTIIQCSGFLHGPLLYHELFQRKKAAKEEDVQKKESEVDAGNDALPEDNVLESIEKRLNDIEKKLNDRKEFLNTEGTEENFNAEEYANFTHEIETEFDNLTEQWNSELEKNQKKLKTEDKNHEKDMIQLPDLARSPVTLEAICYNGLFVFLIGNLLTGIVNMSLYTIYVPTMLSIIILWGYSSCIVLVSLALYWNQIQIKFW